MADIYQSHGMKIANKWKYLVHFQNREYGDFVSKEIIKMLYKEESF